MAVGLNNCAAKNSRKAAHFYVVNAKIHGFLISVLNGSKKKKHIGKVQDKSIFFVVCRKYSKPTHLKFYYILNFVTVLASF